MTCVPLYDIRFTPFSYANSAVFAGLSNEAVAKSWADSVVDSLHERPLLHHLWPLESPHLLVRRIASKLSDPRYHPNTSSITLTKDLSTALRQDPVLKNTPLFPMLSDLVSISAEPYSLFACRLAMSLKREFERGSYLGAIVEQTKSAIISSPVIEPHAAHQLARLLAAELLCLGYTAETAETIFLRCFDDLSGAYRAWFGWVLDPGESITFEKRLDFFKRCILGQPHPYIFTFMLSGLRLTSEVEIDGCKFYRSPFDLVADGPEGLRHESPARSLDLTSAVYAEVGISASNPALAKRLARARLSLVIDRLQNLEPVHRSPVLIGPESTRSFPDLSNKVRLIDPHDFVHGVTWNESTKAEYERFYREYDSSTVEQLLGVAWSHAKRARDSNSEVEKFIAYWTILERICDEAHVYKIQPNSKGSSLIERMSDFLASPFILNLPSSICARLTRRLVFASRPPYAGPFPIGRTRFRVRNSICRKILDPACTVGDVLALLPKLDSNISSPDIIDLISKTKEFFEFGRSASSMIENLRTNLKSALATIYDIRNAIVHDAIVDPVLLPHGLREIELLSNVWLDMVSRIALGDRNRAPSDVLLLQYYSSSSLYSSIKAKLIRSLADWPLDLRNVTVGCDRFPQFDYAYGPTFSEI